MLGGGGPAEKQTGTPVAAVGAAGPLGLALPWESDPSQIVRCVFCGGGYCKSCSKEALALCPNPAVTGLHSNWVSEHMVGMQRPSSRAIKEHNIIEQFRNLGIKAIFNCTMQGEHPYCGDGIIEKTGFSYNPEEFMNGGIEYYNFGWEDMTAPTLPLMLDIVRVASSVLERGGKIAVHCHAGFGRTGLVIGCVLVLRENLSADDAIAKVRQQRPRSIQTRFQEQFVRDFAARLKDLYCVFRPPSSKPLRLTFMDILEEQAIYLHGDSAQVMRWIPKALYLPLVTLHELAKVDPENVAAALVGIAAASPLKQWGLEEELLLEEHKEASNQNHWENWEIWLGPNPKKLAALPLNQQNTSIDPFPEEEVENKDQCPPPLVESSSVDPRIPAQLLYDFLAQLKEPLINKETVFKEMMELIKYQEEHPEENSESLASRLPYIQGLHYGILCTLERIVDIFRILRAKVNEELIHKGYLRIMVALTHADKVFGSVVLNGRDLQHIPDYKNLEKVLKSSKVADSAALKQVMDEMEIFRRCLSVLVDGWHRVPKNLVGGANKGRYNALLPPIPSAPKDVAANPPSEELSDQDGEICATTISTTSTLEPTLPPLASSLLVGPVQDDTPSENLESMPDTLTSG